VFERSTEQLRRIAVPAAVGIAIAYGGLLTLMFRAHDWILSANGRPLISDFLVFWVSGGSALRGAAPAAYDPRLQHLAQEAASGRIFDRYLYWHYPPTFFFAAAVLALLPYAPAFLGWLAATLVAYCAAIAAAARTRLACLACCAAPAVFINAISGQNGCLSSALIAGALFTLEERPLLSGALLGLLAYKPQLGLLFPIALAAGGYWRTLAAAAATIALSVVASAIFFGDETLLAFVRDLPLASSVALVKGANGWHNLQSLYGLARWLGLDNKAASAAQLSLALSAAVALVWLWRQPLPSALKVAALALSSLLVSPYLYIYDFVVLSVPIAFLYRERPFDSFEIAGIALANICVGAFLFFPTPIGAAGTAIVAALILRRAARARAGRLDHFLQGGATVSSNIKLRGRIYPCRLARNTSV
jgi:hypothetical protein